MKFYLDTDIFLAGFKDKDHLKLSAQKFLKDNTGKHEFFTSTATLLEIWHYLNRNNLKEKTLEAVRYVEEIVDEVISLEPETLIEAVSLAEAYSLSPTDAIHAIHAKKFDAIISTDNAFDRVPNLKKIDFSQSSD